MRTRTRIWLALGAAILVAQVLTFGVSRAFTSEQQQALRRASRAGPFILRALESAWNDQANTQQMLEFLHRATEQPIELRANDNRLIQRFGESPCPAWTSAAVGPEQAPLGVLRICQPTGLPPIAGQLFLYGGLGLALFALAVVATRRITNATESLEQTAHRLTGGDFAARSTLHPGAPLELKRLGSALDDLAERVSQHVQTQTQLLATVSHELRSPLARLRVLVELVEHGNDAERTDHIERESPINANVVNELRTEIEDLDKLVGSLLDDARLSFGIGNARPVELGALAKNAAARFADPPSVDVLDDAHVNVDSGLMQRAIAMLIDNAFRHGALPVRVRVDRLRDHPRGERARVTICDNGAGFAPDQLSRLFREKSPAGLGTTLVARIVRAHGGQVTARNQDGGIIELTLPLQQAAPPSDHRAEPKKGPASHGTRS